MPDRFVLIYDQPIKVSASVGMYKDIDPSDEWGGADWNPGGQGVLWYYEGDDKVEGPHDSGHNILFADGHVNWFLAWDPRNMTRNPS